MLRNDIVGLEWSLGREGYQTVLRLPGGRATVVAEAGGSAWVAAVLREALGLPVAGNIPFPVV